MKNFFLNKERFIFAYFLFTPIIEMINASALINHGGESVVGKLYRVAYMSTLVYLLLTNKINKKYLMGILSFVCVTIIPTLVCNLINEDDIQGKIYNMIKYMLPIVTVIVLQQLYSKKMIRKDFVMRIFEFYSWFLPISYFIPLFLGLGYYQYGYERGYKGFNYMINDINIVVAIITIYAAELLFRKRTFVNIFRFVINIICLLYMQTKTSIVVAVVLLIFVFLSLLKERNAMQKILFVLLVFGVLLSVSYNAYQEQIMYYFERLKYGYISMKAEGYSTFDFFTSTRSLRLRSVPELYAWNNNGLVNLLFGLSTKDFINSEMDFFDVLFIYGIFACIYMIGFYGRYIVLALRNYLKRHSLEYLSSLTMIVIILLFSAVGGHVLMSAYSGCILALVCVEIYIQNE